MSCQPSLTSGIFFLEFLAAILGLLVPVGWLTEFPEFPKQDIGLNAKPCISTCKMGCNPPGKRNKLRVRICRVGELFRKLVACDLAVVGQEIVVRPVHAEVVTCHRSEEH